MGRLKPLVEGAGALRGVVGVRRRHLPPLQRPPVESPEEGVRSQLVPACVCAPQPTACIGVEEGVDEGGGVVAASGAGEKARQSCLLSSWGVRSRSQ